MAQKVRIFYVFLASLHTSNRSGSQSNTIKTSRRQLKVPQKSKKADFVLYMAYPMLRVGIKAVPEAMFSYTFGEYYATILYNMALSCIPIPN